MSMESIYEDCEMTNLEWSKNRVLSFINQQKSAFLSINPDYKDQLNDDIACNKIEHELHSMLFSMKSMLLSCMTANGEFKTDNNMILDYIRGLPPIENWDIETNVRVSSASMGMIDLGGDIVMRTDKSIQKIAYELVDAKVSCEKNNKCVDVMLPLLWYMVLSGEKFYFANDSEPFTIDFARTRLNAILAASKRQIKDYIGNVRHAGLDPSMIDANGLALAEMIMEWKPKETA